MDAAAVTGGLRLRRHHRSAGFAGAAIAAIGAAHSRPWLYRTVPGHAAADAVVPGVLRYRPARPRRVALAGCSHRTDAVHQRLPRRDLARLRREIGRAHV